MNSKRLYITLVALIALLGVGIIGGAYLADKMFREQSDELVTQKAISESLAGQQEQLIRDKRDIKKYTELNDIAKAIVPQDKDQTQTIREITNLARESGIPRISSISFPPSTLGGLTAAKPSAGTNLTQLIPVKGISGVYDLRITVLQQPRDAVNFDTFIKFLDKLEQNRRTAQVSNITIMPIKDAPQFISFTLIIDEYIKP
jgi:hypothetical protein